MPRRSRRLGVLTAPCLLLVLQMSGQGTEPTLESTMNFLANAFKSRGTISWRETIPDLVGASYTISSSLTDATADSSACSLSWTTVYTSSDDKLVETSLVTLRTVSGVAVQPYSRYRQSAMQYRFQVSPETYVVVINTDAPVVGKRESYHKNKLKSQTKLLNDREASVGFADVQAANRVADGIRRAVKICASRP